MPRRPRQRRSLLALSLVAALSMLPPLAAAADTPIVELVPDTAVLLNQTSGGGGNGGNTSSTSTMSNIFAPPAYVDYKRLGGEPTTVVDRYPFKPGTFGNITATDQYRDLVYVSTPEGVAFPGFSFFWKSADGGQTFRLPPHDPVFGKDLSTAPPSQGGGDSHQAVGQVTHSVFFLDLPGDCVTINVSRDLGENFVSDELGCGANPGVIDDRQWVEADETASTPNVYISFINFSTQVAPTLSLARSNLT